MINEKTVKWGIIGAGRIANRFAETVAAYPCAEVVAVASKTPQKAEEFAKKHNIANCFSDYEQLVQMDSVDSIYIATTHNFHFENMKLALEHGKNVLCEKAFTINAAQAKEVIDLAKEKNLFLMEALVSRFLPVNIAVKKAMADGKIGRILNINSTFGGEMPPDFNNRFYNPELAGGALLDLGIYTVSYCHFLKDKLPSKISSQIKFAPTGVDETTDIHLEFDDGSTADLHSSLVERSNLTTITGETGTIIVTGFVGGPSAKILYKNGTEDLLPAKSSNSFMYEVVHACNKILKGQKESDVISVSDTYEIMKILDNVRYSNNFYLPEER